MKTLVDLASAWSTEESSPPVYLRSIKMNANPIVRTIPAILVCMSMSLAGQKFVSPSGYDSNSGTKNRPYKTLQKAANEAEPGDTILIREGTYKPPDKITISRSGTARAWITFTNYEDEEVVIDGSRITETPTDKYGMLYINNGAFIRIEGLTIQESRFMGIKILNSSDIEIVDNYITRTFSCGIGVWGCSSPYCRTKTMCKNIKALYNHVELTNNCDLATSANTNCTQKNKAPHEAISFAGVDGFEIAYNHVHHGKKEGIDAKETSRNGTIHHNYVHHHKNTPYTVGIYADSWFGPLFNIEIYENIVHDCDDGISVAAEGKASQGAIARDVRVHHNVLYNLKWRGITLDKATNNSKRENIWIYNNTIYNGTQSGIWINTTNVEDVYVFNNIAAAGGARIRNDAPNNQSVKIYNNLLDGVGENTFKGDNAIIADPKFNDAASFDFALTYGSPAIDAGVTDAEYNDPDGSRGDLGALPYTGDGMTPVLAGAYRATARKAYTPRAYYSIQGRKLGTKLGPYPAAASSHGTQLIIAVPDEGIAHRHLQK